MNISNVVQYFANTNFNYLYYSIDEAFGSYGEPVRMPAE